MSSGLAQEGEQQHVRSNTGDLRAPDFAATGPPPPRAPERTLPRAARILVQELASENCSDSAEPVAACLDIVQWGGKRPPQASALCALLEQIQQIPDKSLLISVLSQACSSPWLSTLLVEVFLASETVLQDLVSSNLSAKELVSVATGLCDSEDASLQGDGLRLLREIFGGLPYSQREAELGHPVLARVLSVLLRRGKLLPSTSSLVEDLASGSLQVSAADLSLSLARSLSGTAGIDCSNMTPESNLLGVVEEMGPSCTSTKSSFKDVLQQFSSVNEASAGQLLAMMCSSRHIDAGGAAGADLHAMFAAALGSSSVGNTSVNAEDGQYNLEVVVDTLVEISPELNWQGVAWHLDCDKFALTDAKGFVQLVMAIKRGLGPEEEFPLSSVLSRIWSNLSGQVSFLSYAVGAPIDAISFSSFGRSAAPLEGLQPGKLPTGSPNSAWLSYDLLETLGKLSDAGVQSDVLAILEQPLQDCPEVLLVTISGCQEAVHLRSRLCSMLLPQYFNVQLPQSSVVLHRVWLAHREGILATMAEMYSKEPAAMEQILDVCQELNALTDVLGSMPFPFSLELATLARTRDYLDLEKWLQDRVGSFGVPFVMACLDFVKGKQRQLVGLDGSQPTPIQLKPELMSLFLRFLNSNLSMMPLDAQEMLKDVQAQASDLATVDGANVVDAALTLTAAEAFTEDIEEEANSHFQKIYTAQMSILDVVGMLQRFKSSSVQREQEIFACMIHNLFDEYRFFPKYPDKELHITAVLFGALVQHQLVSSVTLGIALRYVLDALRKPLGSKMFTFGLEALNQFRGIVGQWTQYCQHILQIPHLQQSQAELCAFIEKQMASGVGSMPDLTTGALGDADTDVSDAISKGISVPVDSSTAGESSSKDGRSSMEGLGIELLAEAVGSSVETSTAAALPTAPSSTSAPAAASSAASAIPTISHLSGSLAGGGSAAPSFASTINAETLDQASSQWQDFPKPEEAVQDRVHFLINNVSVQNLEQKSEEVRSCITEEFIPWFTNYLVVKRVAQEANFHALYLHLLEKLGDSKVMNLTVRATHHYVKVLLASEHIKTNSGERSLLKNLGSFLGQLTIAKNKPVLQRDLDTKAVIAEAYKNGKMIAVIPFVHKVLEACSSSRIFHPPNPWLMGIVALLAEIYAQDKLKLNLKFEIEMLFKDLHLQIADIQPSTALKDADRERGSSNPDFTADKPAPGVSAASSQGKASLPHPSSAGVKQRSTDGATIAAMPGTSLGGEQQMPLHNYVVINPSLAVVADRLQLKRVVPVAVDRAISEIITPVVERSVTIACMTTQELIMKDFAMEPDDGRIRNAAHQMVSSLAGSLALVTCKEPLRVSLSNQLRQLLSPNCPEQSILEQTMSIVSQDNLDLGCNIIEKAATDKAIRDIDDRLLQVYQVRQKAKAAGQQFRDPSMEARIPASLPDALRPRPGHLNQQQQSVYSEFSRAARTASMLQSSGATGSAPSRVLPHMLSGGYSEVDQQHAEPAPMGPRPEDASGSLSDKYAAWQARMEAYTTKDPSGLFGAQQEGSEGRQLMAELAEMCRKAAGREELLVALGQRLFRALVSGQQTRMHITACVTALEVLREAAGFRRLPLHITQWYTTSMASMEEERAWSRAAAEALLRAHLLHLPDFDTHLAKALTAAPYGPAPELAVHLIRTCILSPEPVATASDLYSTLEVLLKIAARSSSSAAIVSLVDQARQVAHVGPRAAMAGRGGAVAKTPIGNKIDKGDPIGLREQVAALFDEWARLLEGGGNDRDRSNFMAQLHMQGFLKGDELTDRFLRILTELAVAHCITSESPAGLASGRPSTPSFVAVDALVRLLNSLIQAHGLGASLLAKALAVITGVLQGDADERGGAFNSRPYFRLLLGLICELSPAETSNATGMGFLVAIAAALQALQPLRVPGFAFSWLELVSHRQLMPKLLQSPVLKGQTYVQRLLVSLFRFLEPYLRNAQLSDPVRLLYRGTLRVLLVLLHDFPEFLCENHFTLCDAIPPSCIQMRNLILSAFPRNMRLPDPFTPNLKVDLLPEISQAPRIVAYPDRVIPNQLQGELDIYLKSRQPMAFLDSLCPRLLLGGQDQPGYGTRYNSTLINALVLYTGMQAIAAKGGQQGSSPTMHSPAMDVFKRLASELDTEGRYLFLNAIANQLRYPNNHTHYFSCVLLYLFSEAQQEIIQEQITRVLLERLIVNRPHPWGLLITFIELIKNPRYNFWSHSFTRCAQEIEKLFETVAKSCMGPPSKPEDDINQMIMGSGPQDGHAAARG